MLGVHCVAHWTNLAIQTLSKLPLILRLKQYYNQSTPIILYFVNDIWIMQAWRIFGAKGLEDSS
jgi:hypothetical protein